MAQNDSTGTETAQAETGAPKIGYGEGEQRPEIGGPGYDIHKEADSLPHLEDEEIDRLVDIIKGGSDLADGAAALTFLMDNIMAHSEDEGYVFNVACRARDRALFRSRVAEDGIRAFARKASENLEQQLRKWEGREPLP